MMEVVGTILFLLGCFLGGIIVFTAIGLLALHVLIAIFCR